ncbi:hypothetical protein ACSS7Z_00115 [Microbacterium sp. A82]|uniref:hypothetical protein n=1 Tax=Microbacterium sp. A82 TaxID=3450452 RepID=UPI003F33A79C
MKKLGKSAPAQPRRTAQSSVATIARVDLLPPIVGVRRKENATTRLLALGLVGLALIAAVSALAVSFLANAAEGALADENARKAQLLIEQKQYSEVSGIKALLVDYETAEYSALYSETDWARLMRELDMAMPEGVEITSEVITVKGVSTTSSSASALDVTGLDHAGVIEISFTAAAEVFDSPTPLLNALQAFTGYSTATVSAVSGQNDEGYVITGSVQLNAAALGGTGRVGELDAEQLAALHSALEASVALPEVAPAAPADGEAAGSDELTEDATGAGE